MSNQEFLPLYLLFLIAATIERVTNTFFQKKVEKKSRVYFKWSFPLLLFAYLFIVGCSVSEYFLNNNLINIRISGVGLLSYFLGVFLRREAIKALDEDWSVHIEIKQNHRFVKTGVYQRINHPYYLAVLFELVGISLYANSYLASLLVVFLQLPLLIFRAKLEENVLLKHFS